MVPGSPGAFAETIRNDPESTPGRRERGPAARCTFGSPPVEFASAASRWTRPASHAPEHGSSTVRDRNPVPVLGRAAWCLRVAVAGALPRASFASQAGVLVLSPILSDVADDFGVSIAAAGQLRILAAPLAVVAALVAGRLLTRYSPRALLGVASALLAVGSLASAAAPSFALLALAQIPMWIGIAMILTAGVAATAAWSEPERRTRVVAHAFAGPPTAWIVGMPLIGLVAEVNWRLAFLALPLPAALLAGLAVAGRPHDAPIPASRDLSPRPAPTRRRTTLGARRAVRERRLGGDARVQRRAPHRAVRNVDDGDRGRARRRRRRVPPGNRRAGHGASERARRTMLACSLAAAVTVALTWTVTPVVAITLVFFAASGALVATRTVVGDGLRIQRRGRPRSRGRHRTGRHHPARVPRRRARRRRGDRRRRGSPASGSSWAGSSSPRRCRTPPRVLRAGQWSRPRHPCRRLPP